MYGVGFNIWVEDRLFFYLISWKFKQYQKFTLSRLYSFQIRVSFFSPPSLKRSCLPSKVSNLPSLTVLFAIFYEFGDYMRFFFSYSSVGGKAKPLKQPKAKGKEYDEVCLSSSFSSSCSSSVILSTVLYDYIGLDVCMILLFSSFFLACGINYESKISAVFIYLSRNLKIMIWLLLFNISRWEQCLKNI